MRAFEYASPTSVADAVKALGVDRGMALAGGTDLISRLKDDVIRPARVVYVKSIKDLGGISIAGDTITIGATARLVDIVNHEGLAKAAPAVRQAALEVGSPQIRNMATLGGNLCQCPSDWYFRNGFGLLGGKKQGGDLVRELEGEYAPIDVSETAHLVRDGDNRYASIFMTDGDALYAHSSSLAPPLIALGAQATLAGPDGERTIPVAALYRVPKAAGESALTLKPGELLTKVSFSNAPANATYEVRQKQSHDWPLVLCSVALTMDGDKVGKASIILGSVAPVPYRAEAAEAAIAGHPITTETAEAAGKAAVEGAKPLSMNAYKVALTRTAVKRALLAAAGQRYWEV